VNRIFVLTIIGLMVLTGCGSQATFGDPIVDGEPTPVPTAIVPTRPIYTVQRGDIIYEREFQGRIAPVVSQDLFFQQDGRVAAIYFEDGSDALAGDVLAALDTSALEQQLQQAETDLGVAQSLLQSAIDGVEFARRRASLNLDLAQLRLDYAVAQAGEPPAPQDTFTIQEREIERDLAQLSLDEINTEIDQELRVAVTAAERRVAGIQSQIDTAQLVAPLDGRLLALRLSVGDPVVAFESVGVIADLRALEVQDLLTSTDMSELTEGMPATIKVRNRPGETFDGTIIALPRPFGSGDDEITRIRFNDPAEGATFRVGELVTIVIRIAEHTDVLWLPRAAIREYNGRDFVVVDDNGIQQRVDVELGLASADRVEILSGLELNQTVVGP
jgi:HlyD family secretion protein